MRISDWSSDVCSSELGQSPVGDAVEAVLLGRQGGGAAAGPFLREAQLAGLARGQGDGHLRLLERQRAPGDRKLAAAHFGAQILFLEVRLLHQPVGDAPQQLRLRPARSEEHTSELQSLMRISYAVFCLKKKKKKHN